jgi:hypothetical protein
MAPAAPRSASPAPSSARARDLLMTPPTTGAGGGEAPAAETLDPCPINTEVPTLRRLM